MLQNKIYHNFFLEIFKTFFIILLGLSLIALTVRAVSFLDLIVDNGYSISNYFKYSFLNLFGITPKFFPLAFLLTITIFITKHLQDSEFIILWTSGVKKIQIVNLLFFISLLILLIYLILAIIITPYFLNKSRLLLSNDNVSSFSAGDYAFFGSYARKLKVPGLSMGGSAKVIYRQVGDFAKSWGFGLDAGLKYKRNEHFTFGLMARDVTSTFNAWVFTLDEQTQNIFLQTGNEIPQNGLELTLPRLIIAASTQYNLGSKGLYAGGEIDIDITTDGKRNTLLKLNPFSLDPHCGIKIGFKDLVQVRGGISSIQQFSNVDSSQYWGMQPNLGLGIGFKGFSLDS